MAVTTEARKCLFGKRRLSDNGRNRCGCPEGFMAAKRHPLPLLCTDEPDIIGYDTPLIPRTFLTAGASR